MYDKCINMQNFTLMDDDNSESDPVNIDLELDKLIRGADNIIQDISEDIKEFKENNETELDLSKRVIEIIPEDIKELDSLERLSLANNFISGDNLKREYFPNIKQLDLSNNPLKEIDFKQLPKSITELLLVNCELTHIDGIEELLNLEKIDISENNIKIVNDLPNNLIKLIANSSNIETFSKEIPEGVEIISLKDNRIEDAPTFPSSTVSIYLDDNFIEEINEIPVNIQKYHAACNKIKKINCEFPSSMEQLNLEDNNLKKIPTLPPELTHCNLGDNRLKDGQLMEIPDSLIYMNIEMNKFTKLPPGLIGSDIAELKIEGNNFCSSDSDENNTSDLNVDDFYGTSNTSSPSSPDNDSIYNYINIKSGFSNIETTPVGYDISKDIRMHEDNPCYIKPSRMVEL